MTQKLSPPGPRRSQIALASNVMRKMAANRLSDLVRMAMTAGIMDASKK